MHGSERWIGTIAHGEVEADIPPRGCGIVGIGRRSGGMIEIDDLRLAQWILRGVQEFGRLQWCGRVPCQPDSRADTLVQRSHGKRRKMIDTLPLFSQDEDTQTINEIGRKKLADLRNFADALKHTLTKLRLRRNALHHGGEKLGRRIGFLRRESTRHQKTEKHEAQRDVCWSMVVEGTRESSACRRSSLWRQTTGYSVPVETHDWRQLRSGRRFGYDEG